MQFDNENTRKFDLTSSDIEVELNDNIENIDIPTLLISLERRPDREHENPNDGTRNYIVGEKKIGIYIEETGGLSERDALALIELLPDDYIYIRKSKKIK